MQAAHRVADRLAHPLHLVLAALVDRQLEAPRRRGGGPGRGGEAVVELDAFREPAQRLAVWVALDLGLVDLVHLVARVREPVGELTVVREQQRAGRVRVETADRDDAGLGRDEPDDRRPALRVAGGRHGARRLVQEAGRRAAASRPAGRRARPCRAAPDERVQLARLPVHAHAAGLDQLVGACAATRLRHARDRHSGA